MSVVTLPVSQPGALEFVITTQEIFPHLSSLTLCWKFGVICFFMVALWYSEAIKTNLSLYYLAGRQEIRTQNVGEQHIW